MGYGRNEWTNSNIESWTGDWRTFLQKFKKIFSNKSSMSFPKLHQAEHVAELIKLFGAPCEWRALDFESVHKRAKQEGKNFNKQSSIAVMLMKRVCILIIIYYELIE